MPENPDENTHDLDEDEEGKPEQITSQELLLLRMAERRRQLTQNRQVNPLPSGDGESASHTDGYAGWPPPMPPWPTPVSGQVHPSAGEELPGAPRTAPMSTANQRVAPPSPPPPLKREPTQPFFPQQAPERAMPPTPPSGSFSFPGWRSFRRHSPWLIPVGLVLVFFLLVLVINAPRAGPMFFIFAAIGVLQAAVLLYAPNDAFWVVGVIGGVVLFTAVAFFVFFTPLFAAILSILLLALGVVALRERYYPVKEGTVAVMGLFEKYNRTLQPGFNLLVPGEKVLGVIDTQRIRYETRIPSLTLLSGEQVTVEVAMYYQVIPGQEYLAIRNTKDWRVPVQQQLVAVVQDVLSTLSLDDFRRDSAGLAHPGGTGGNGEPVKAALASSPLDLINERLTAAMREQVADRGVAVHAVRVLGIEGPHLPGRGRASAPQVVPSVSPTAVSHPTMVLPGTLQGKEAVSENAVQNHVPAMQPAPEVPGAGNMTQPPAGLPGGSPAGAGVPPSSAQSIAGQPVPSRQPPAPPGVPAPPSAGPVRILPPEALAEMYDAVLRQRVTDAATIQRIIAQFEAVAADPVLNQRVPFDAEAGAHNLRQHLLRLQASGIPPAFAPPAGDSSVPPAPPSTPAEPERP